VRSQREPQDKARRSMSGYGDRESVLKMFDKYTGLRSQNALVKEGEANVSMFRSHIETANRKKLTEDEIKETYGAFRS